MHRYDHRMKVIRVVADELATLASRQSQRYKYKTWMEVCSCQHQVHRNTIRGLQDGALSAASLSGRTLPIVFASESLLYDVGVMRNCIATMSECRLKAGVWMPGWQRTCSHQTGRLYEFRSITVDLASEISWK